MLAKKFSVLVLILTLSSILNAQEGIVNQGFLKSTRNLQANLVLTEVPLGLVGLQDRVTIKWTPAVSGVFRYSMVPGGGNPANYPSALSSEKLLVNTNGEIQFRGEKLPAGVHYCIITSGSDHSAEFIVIRESEISPRMISPKTAQGEAGINTNSPIFTWEEVNGVPFYHLILSDQPFTVTKDEQGNTKAEGANIIWQAITPENSIPYGIPDPSGFFTITSPPPLVKGVRYNWIVVNNYGNNPALSSSVTSGPTGFEVNVPPPFNPPVNIEPARGSIKTSDVITFIWSQVEGASLYHIYLSRFEDVEGSQALVPVWDGVTSNPLYDLSASVMLQEGKYYWKVLAQNESGNGAMGDTTSFYYSACSATVHFYTVELQGQTLPRANLTLESLSYGMNPMPLATDGGGFLERVLPLGAYRVLATKVGYEDTSVVFTLSIQREVKKVTIPLRQSPSSVYGSTKDANQNPLGFVQIRAASQRTSEVKETTSDINGNFSLGLLSDTWLLTASKSGYTSAPQRTIDLGPGVNLNLDIPANGGPFILTKNIYIVSGLVTTPSGEAIWGTKIIATQGEKQEQVITNAQGQYSITLGTGNWTIEAAKDGYVSPQPQSISILDHNISLNLVLTPKANIISGTVSSRGIPLSNAQVLALPGSGQTIATTTDAYGHYTLSLT
ncbi:MAG: carboxypeptidase-like regulatory domain-containing protein, partial [candidate division KSB1 bacterium]|nr:carboxypeptidase-like regulatory domain-containing protein [candidate division KSB1 bacterium]